LQPLFISVTFKEKYLEAHIMMHLHVPSEQWPELMNQFGRLHHGKPVRIELIDASGVYQYSHDQPLLGLLDERHGQSDECITVMWGGRCHGLFSHGIRKPRRISTAEWNDAISARLEIESADGQRMVIHAGPDQETLPPGVITDSALTEARSVQPPDAGGRF
jgi:hypothetical protein